jgi:CBS domain-containing protein
VLAPLLILGGAMGWLVGLALPGPHGMWALLGMAAMLGGTMRAPLTATAFAVELTGDIHMLTPLLTATVTAYALTVLLLKRSILTEKIARRGQHITREYGVDPYELTRVEDIMVKNVDTLPADMSIGEAVAELERGLHRIYPVIDRQGRPVGLVSRADALRWRIEGGHKDEHIADLISDASLEVARPDDLVARAVDLMLQNDQGRLPVADPKTGRLVGLLTRKDVLRVRASVRQSEGDRRAYLLPTRLRATVR